MKIVWSTILVLGLAALFDVQNAETTTAGRLGERLQIGGTTRHFNSNDTGLLQSTRQRGQEQRTILIKVDEIP